MIGCRQVDNLLRNGTPVGHGTVRHLGLRGALGSFAQQMLPGGFHLRAQRRIRGGGAGQLEGWIVFKNMHNHQFDPQGGGKTNGGINSVSRPRGTTSRHENVLKHAVLLSQVFPATRPQAGKDVAYRI